MSLEFQHLVDPLHPLVREPVHEVVVEVHRQNVEEEGRHNLDSNLSVVNSCTSRLNAEIQATWFSK